MAGRTEGHQKAGRTGGRGLIDTVAKRQEDREEGKA
jgi:hypothetical protein